MLRAAIRWMAAVVVAAGVAVQAPGPPSEVLPAAATAQLVASLKVSRAHAAHIWRDTPPFNPDGTVNGYIEIPRGDSRKWEFDMQRNARAVDRVIPRSLGGYPVNYGYVPQTVSYDGDPFDILVLGPASEGGTLVRGVIVGLMHMIDDRQVDSKVVASPAGSDGRPRYTLTASEQQRIADFFKRYKLHEPGESTSVPGWDSREQGRAYVETTHAFFLKCRSLTGECALNR